jgi:hypothetical protein
MYRVSMQIVPRCPTLVNIYFDESLLQIMMWKLTIKMSEMLANLGYSAA